MYAISIGIFHSTPAFVCFGEIIAHPCYFFTAERSKIAPIFAHLSEIKTDIDDSTIGTLKNMLLNTILK